MVTAIAVALAGRAGARLARALGIVAGKDTMLKLLRQLPEPAQANVEVLGIDDFALRRGHVYGTVLLDMLTGRPVDVLPGRDAGPVADWLRAHPGVRVVCRDRAGAYALAARDGAPDAIQCADRWHLWHNLAGHVERAVARHHSFLKPATSITDTSSATSPATAPQPPPTAERPDHPTAELQSAVVERIRERHATIQALQAGGQGLREIGRQLGLDRKTVRRFAQASSADDLIAKAFDRPTVLDVHKPYLCQRWNQGCRDVTALHTELQQRGYRGSVRTLYRFLQSLRGLDSSHAVAPGQPTPPRIRHVTTWLLRRPEDLDRSEQATLADIQAACPQLDRLGKHITTFAKMMVHRTGADSLDTWLANVEADEIPELHTFARGIRQDYAAVRNGLTLPHNSGACEGAVNKIKTIKRQMYGRASFSLLRKRILLNA